MIDLEELRKQVVYNPETGILTRISKPKSSKAKLGPIKGTKKTEGHLKIHILGREYYLHQLVWILFYGVWATKIIDHKDCDPTNNRIKNLRLVTRLGNLQNQRKAHSTNKSGLLGVNFRKDRNKYCAEISINSEKKHLGYFNTPEEAHNAYVLAKRIYHPTCTL